MEVHILTLKYGINFHDADEGDCYAGEGQKLISVYQDRKTADMIADKFNPIFKAAEKEHIICPRQKNNYLLKEQFGFDLHDLDNGYDFKLSVETFNVKKD
jgi:hypothetical protein